MKDWGHFKIRLNFSPKDLNLNSVEIKDNSVSTSSLIQLIQEAKLKFGKKSGCESTPTLDDGEQHKKNFTEEEEKASSSLRGVHSSCFWNIRTSVHHVMSNLHIYTERKPSAFFSSTTAALSWE